MEFAYSLSMYSPPVRVRPANGRNSSTTNTNTNTNTYTFVHGANKQNKNNHNNTTQSDKHSQSQNDDHQQRHPDEEQGQHLNSDHSQHYRHNEAGTGGGQDQAHNSSNNEDDQRQDNSNKKTRKRKGSSVRSRIPGRRRPPPAGTLPQGLAHRPASHYSHSRTSSSFSASSSRTSHEAQTQTQAQTQTHPQLQPQPQPPLPLPPQPSPNHALSLHTSRDSEHYSSLASLASTHAPGASATAANTVVSSPPAASNPGPGASVGVGIGSTPQNGRGDSAVATTTPALTTTNTNTSTISSSSPAINTTGKTNTQNSTVASASAPPLTAPSASNSSSIASASPPSASTPRPNSDPEPSSVSPKSSRFIRSVHIPIFSSDSAYHYHLTHPAGLPPTTNKLQKRDSLHYQSSTAHGSQRPSTPTSSAQSVAGPSSPARRRSSKGKHHHDAMPADPSQHNPPRKHASAYAASGHSNNNDQSGNMTSNDNLVLSSKEGSIAPSSASVSTKHSLSAAKQFIMRGNRLYINQPSLLYPLPVDLAELHRQSLRTLMLLQLFGGPTTAPEFSNKPPSRVLEVGCGSAFWSMMCHRYFAQHGHSSISFTGLDIAPLVGMGLDGGWRPDKDMRWRFVQHDVRRRPWPFVDGEFDLIMVKDMSLSLSTSMRDSQQLFEEYLRVLKPGGVIEFWESDHAVRMLRPHVLRAPTARKASSDSDSDDSSEEEDDAEKLGAYIMTNNTPLSAPLNPFLVEYNGWAIKGLDALGLSAVPCALIGAYLLQEIDTLMELRSKRIAVPLSEIRWEREGVGGVVTKDGKSYIDSMKKKGRSSGSRGGRRGGLTTSQAALRRTALETMVGLILCLEPIIREVSGKSQDEWDGWCGKMMNDLLREGGTSWGECLEVGAWCARKKLLAPTT